MPAFRDTSHGASVQKVPDFSIQHISKLSELPSALSAAARMLSDMAGGEGSRGAAEQLS